MLMPANRENLPCRASSLEVVGFGCSAELQHLGRSTLGRWLDFESHASTGASESDASGCKILRKSLINFRVIKISPLSLMPVCIQARFAFLLLITPKV